MVNLDPHEPVEIAPGDRIAQLVIVAVPEVSPAFVEELPDSSRGDGRVRLHGHRLTGHRLKLRITVPRMDAQSADVAQW